MKIAIVGIGNLGSALAKLLISSHDFHGEITAVTRGSERSLKSCQGLGLEGVGYEGVRGADLVVLTVKPQDGVAVCSALRDYLSSDVVLLSMIAGFRCSKIAKLTGVKAVARAMPNLGALVGESATSYFCEESCAATHVQLVEYIVNSCGVAVRVFREELLDVATAVAGSGPAYICWLAEQMELVGIEGGFTEAEARQLVLQTFKGAVSYLESVEGGFSELRERVTSPGGTTAAALRLLESERGAEVMRRAIDAALRRCLELGGGDV
jgi:pyrroline-5-carboxylate reductase